MTNDELLEERIREWRESFRRRQAVRDADVEELEDHLRSQVEALSQAGLDADEAFLVAVKRLGNLDSVSHEFANEYTERLWKQLVIGQGSSVSSAPARREATLAVGLAVAAAVAVKLPELFGKRIVGPDPDESFYAHNLGLLILPFLAAF